jgi:hypothetical protein
MLRFLSVVILIIQVKDFSFDLVDFERDPPITSDSESPSSFALPGELVYVPVHPGAPAHPPFPAGR